MTFPPQPDFTDEPLPTPGPTGAPLHGFQGDRGPTSQRLLVPAGLTIAISREAGARGTNIARRIAKRLGWPMYDQELLDYIAREGLSSEEPPPSAAAIQWAEDGAAQCVATGRCSSEPAVVDLVRTVYSLASKGNVVFLGRGAGWILPRATTMHVRIIAPEADRISFFSQWLRQTLSEAAEQLRIYDARRQAFLQGCLNAQADDSHAYDLVLNSGSLGEELCVELILLAAAVKQAARA